MGLSLCRIRMLVPIQGSSTSNPVSISAQFGASARIHLSSAWFSCLAPQGGCELFWWDALVRLKRHLVQSILHLFSETKKSNTNKQHRSHSSLTPHTHTLTHSLNPLVLFFPPFFFLFLLRLIIRDGWRRCNLTKKIVKLHRWDFQKIYEFACHQHNHSSKAGLHLLINQYKWGATAEGKKEKGWVTRISKVSTRRTL
ncbi:MAG: hypothetical protein J3Q66DRAFT_72387 [Benniella sp.]|nr:MAG: hypothetical protein J3Q66DRAFT_72387 [Benniella sp.]